MEGTGRRVFRAMKRVAACLAIALAVLALLALAFLAVLFWLGGGLTPPSAPAPDKKIRWNGPIALCFAEADPGDRERIAMVRSAAEAWMRESGAVFRFQMSCATENGSRPVPILFLRDPGALAAADDLGNTLAGGGEVRLRAEFPMNDPTCGDDGSVGALGCVYAEAVHELGHVLGFVHDHVSANAPKCAGMKVSLEEMDARMTYYDSKSVMNYCNPDRWRGRLSEADICSVQVAYPKPGAPPRQPEECERIAAGEGQGKGAPVKAAR